MMFYIIGPAVFQHICLGLILNYFGVKYESQLQEKQRQEAA